MRKTVDFYDRTFEGVNLSHSGWHSTKTEAQRYAMNLREKGYKARVVKHFGGYSVYSNK